MTEIKFGTDGWRAVVADEFTFANVRRIADATGAVFAADHPGGLMLVGYDTRYEGPAFADVAARILAAHGLRICVSDRFLPTPALSWQAAQTDAVGAIMLTASHNPAEYSGFKIKLGDGGSAPPSFTARVEAAIPAQDPGAGKAGRIEHGNLVAEYLEALKAFVDGDAIAAAGLEVVVDPLYGAGQGYLANALRDLGVDVVELHAEPNPGFGGLHPEPIPPHIDELAHAVCEMGRSAGFCTDGDADRIGGIDANGAFVNPQRIFSIILRHLVEDRGMTGSVVKTLSTSVLVDRTARALGLEVITTPVGFKHIYEHMVAGGVLIGGEESGGIGIPAHVRERDGLLMALLLAETMAVKGRGLGELVEDLFALTGPMEYRRVDLKLEPGAKDAFLAAAPTMAPAQLAGHEVLEVQRADGVKFLFPDDTWLLLRPSGTEPLVRVYAEASTTGEVDDLLAAGEALVLGADS